jgi:hypothetical protein
MPANAIVHPNKRCGSRSDVTGIITGSGVVLTIQQQLALDAQMAAELADLENYPF